MDTFIPRVVPLWGVTKKVYFSIDSHFLAGACQDQVPFASPTPIWQN